MYNNGKLEGMCERYGDNGKVKECGIYVNGLLHGVKCYRQFYPNGRLKAVQSYSNGQLHGDSVYFTQKGTQTAKHHYVHGECKELSFK
jgi:antitoxin component YwqK of YwqJK toxin-antitoxin module